LDRLSFDQPLWEAAKARQRALDERAGNFWQRQRPQYLLSGLLRCGVCGGRFAKISAEHYGCSAARNKGASVCANKRTIKREKLEGAVLAALQTHLMDEGLVEAFCAEYTRHLNALRREMNAAREVQKSELAKLG
jgi:site-specific DNA recombinase